MRLKVLAVALALASGASATDNPTQQISLAEGLEISIPSGVRLTRDRPVEDFEIVKFTLGSRQILSAYVGNHPSFPSLPSKGVKKARLGSMRVSRVEMVDAKGKSAEALFETGLEEPSYVHFGYGHLNADDSKRADAIIASLRLRRHNEVTK